MALLELQRLAGNAAVTRLVGDEAGSLRQMVETAVQAPGTAPLPASVRARMEPVLGEDLGDVQVRTDRVSTEALDARAFTLGNDIVLHPGDAGGGASTDRILAHEAVHVAQQRSGPVSGRAVGGVAVSDPGDAFEREAERLSSAASGPEAAGAAHGGASGGGAVLQRFPATALSAPAPWQAMTDEVTRPGEGLSGGIYILTSNEESPEVRTVVAKPIFGRNGLGTAESSAQMTFGDRAIAGLFGIRTPTSRGVPKGSPEFEQLVAVCSPKAPPRPETDDGSGDWQPLSEAKSFIVMAEVPKGSSLKSLADKAGTDHAANDRLLATVFDGAFLRQLGRLCVADLLIGNDDRMVAGAMNLGNLMVSPGETGPELWAIDSSALLGKLDPGDVLSGGSGSGSLNKGFNTTKSTLDDGPAERLDGFFRILAANMRVPDQGGGDGPRVDPAEMLTHAYEANREQAVEAFEAGWTSGLETVRELVETKTGRKKMKDLTDEVRDEDGAENVSYTTLKTNALYLGARANGASHDEAKRDPATYAAMKVLAEFDPASIQVPEDGHSWNVARVPSSDVLTAQLEHIDALPAPGRITHVLPSGGKWKSYDPAVFREIVDAAGNARDEVAQLGAKKRGIFSKSSQPRNRVIAGRFVAETYELGAAAIRGASVVGSLQNLASALDVAIGGQASPAQAARAVPAADFLERYVPKVRRDFAEYGDSLRAASKGVAKLRRYAPHPALADVLARLADYVDSGDERLAKGKLANPNLYANVLKSAASQH